MEARVNKFRVWDNGRKEWVHGPGYEVNLFGETIVFGEILRRPDDSVVSLDELHNLIPLQFTGKKCFNDREVYEDDILFYEEETENGDRRYYLVVTWIKEWSMFATLHVSEYKKYLTEGAEALDESMFWTYTLEGCGDYHYAGNIWEDPYLIRYPDEDDPQ